MEALMLASSRATSEAAVPLVEEHLTVAIDGQEASTTLRQVWNNQTSARIEGHYSLRAGSGSHVDGFAYWNGEQKIVGEVFEKETASEVYRRVTTRRRDPGLLEEAGEGAFAFKIFPVEPHENKRVEVRWSKWLERHGQTVHYVAPLGRKNSEIVVNLVGPIKNVRSTTHKLTAEPVPGGLRMRASDATSSGTLDLSWDVDEPAWTPGLYVHADGKNDGYFAMSLATPATTQLSTPKDVTLVIDRSGSMSGDPIEHADEAAAKLVDMLGDEDRVNVIAFSDEVDPLFAKPQPVAQARAQARTFARNLVAGGGTDIALALATAIKDQDRREGRPRIVVFMTDGQSDLEKALAAAQTDTGDVRLFTLGLGKEVNRPLLQRLAALKHGRFSYIADAAAIEPEVRRVAEHIAHPVLVDLAVEVEGAQASRIYPRSLPDLFADDEVVITGRLRGTGPTKLTLHGKLGGKPFTWSRMVDTSKTPPRRWVGGLWAQARVEHLLEELSIKADQPELKTEAIELALAYNFVTPFTAFLAVPESELGDAAPTLAAARAHKQEVLARHQDATALGGTTVDPDAPAPVNGTVVASTPSPARTRTPLEAGPALDAKASRADADGADEGDAEDARPSKRGRVASADDADEDRSPRFAAQTAANRHGCAGCASNGDAGGTLALALGVVATLARRRRRAAA